MKKYNYNLKKKSVIITGSSSGIGFEIAKSYLINGANVMICSSKKNNIKNAYKKLLRFKKDKQYLLHKKADVSSYGEIKNLVKFALKKFKKIDILINNAGIYGPKGSIDKVDWKKWVKTVKINLFGSIMLCKEILPHFKKRNKGKIIQLSGGGAAAPLPNITGYAVSKVGIVRFIESLSYELKNYKIDVNSVAPGTINTKMLREILKSGPKKIGKIAYKKALIQKKDGGSSIKDLSELILFLGSSQSDGISGKLISSIWDDWRSWTKKINLLKKNDIFTLRRITPKDRGIKWGILNKRSIYDRSLVPTNKLKK
tara:strand:+ start:1439 stop:2377 length:939 start_codon:yes stop_codon:yes gene_type:complete